jgi:hypothetical protein
VPWKRTGSVTAGFIRRATPTATRAAISAARTAWSTRLIASVREDPPTAFSTAKSRTRSIADRYETAPMIRAATSHINTRIALIVEIAFFTGVRRSVSIWLEVRAARPAGRGPCGVPRVTMALASACPPKPIACASGSVR